MGGSSLEVAFEALTEARRPLCARRFMDGFGHRPASVHSAKSVAGCDPKASNLLWGHLSLDLEVRGIYQASVILFESCIAY